MNAATTEGNFGVTLRAVIAALAVLYTLVVVVVAIVEGLSAPDSPQSNIRYLHGAYAVNAVARGDVLDRAGVRPGDRLIRINGCDLPTTHEFWNRLRAVTPGDEVVFTVEREGALLELKTRTTHNVSLVDATRVLLPVLVLILLGSGVFLIRPTSKAAFLLLVYSLMTAINDIVQISFVVGSAWPQQLLSFAYTMTSLASTAVLLHLFVVFPQRRRAQQLIGLAVPFAYLIQLALALDYYLPVVFPSTAVWLARPSVALPLMQLHSASTVACYLLAFMSMLATLRSDGEPLVKAQAGVLASGLLLLAALQLFLVDLPLRLSGRMLVDAHSVCLFDLVLPLAVAAAIVGYRLFGINVLIRHGIVYGSASVVVTLVFVLLMVSIGWLGERLWPEASWAAMAVAAAVAAILFHPVRLRAQVLVDRFIYRRRYSYRQLLSEAGSRLAGMVELPVVIEYLYSLLVQSLGPTWLTVAVRDLEGSGYGVYDEYGRRSLGLSEAESKALAQAVVGKNRAAEAAAGETCSGRHPALIVPIVRGADHLALLVLGPRPDGIPYLPEDVEFVETVASMAGAVIESARLMEDRATRERLALLGSAASSIIHELKNPLGAIHSTLAVLRRRLREDPQSQELTEIVDNEVGHLKDRVMNVLAFVRPRARDFAPVDPAAILSELLPVVEAEYSSLGIRVVVDDSRAVEVSGDPERLRQVFLNLLLNAREAMPEGGEITVLIARVDDGVTIEVADSGPGFQPEHLGRVFEAFFTTKTLGTGLGLANVKRIVEAHGGRIAVRNGNDRGAVVSLWLPAC